jgi:hypothetical protein
MNTWLPYVVAAFLGLVVGVTEVIATFSANPRDAFRTIWSWILILFNTGITLGVFAIIVFYTPTTNKLVLAAAVGVGLPALIRTNFIVIKQFQGAQDLSINAGWLYDRLLGWFKQETDVDLVSIRGNLVMKLIQSQEINELKETADTVLQQRSLISTEDVKKQQQYIDDIVASNMSARTKQSFLATFIYTTGGRDYVENLVRPRWMPGLFKRKPANV